MEAVKELRSEYGLRRRADRLERTSPAAEACLPTVNARVVPVLR